MKQLLAAICVCIAACFFVFAYNPPAGGESANTLFSPELLGGQTGAAGGPFGDTAPADLGINPALSGFEQRIVFDASGGLFAGFGTEKGVKGGFANIDFLYPDRWGVITADVHFFSSTFQTLPLGTGFSLRCSYAKDLTDKLSIGTGLYGVFGSGWGLGADLGMLYKFGDLGFAKDSRLGISITGMGKPYNAHKGGIQGSVKKTSGFPGMFTPRAGFSTTFVSVKHFKLGMSADLSFPTFQNMVFDTGLHMKFANMVTLKTGWNFNLRETLQKRQTYIPSFGVACSINLNSEETTELNAWKQSEITPQIAVKPFHDNIWAFGSGVNVKVGREDTVPPAITVNYPETVYISPNSDGVQDILEIPVTITDERYVAGWSCTIEDEQHEAVRTIANKTPLRRLEGAQSFLTLLTASKTGIEVPPAIRWDGMLDSGSVAPDGTYYFSITASDDNGNTAKTERYAVVVDNTPPDITVTPPTGPTALIFSPDGDGNKDTLRMKQEGSHEEKWTAVVVNEKNEVVRSVGYENTAPSDFIWDGKNTAGDFVDDSVYTYRISSTDKAGNTAMQEVPNIIVDTIKPVVHIAINTGAFSPNNDGIKDTIVLTPEIQAQKGLQEWKIEITDKAGTVVHQFTEQAIKPIVFDGKNAKGISLLEGMYQAVISARYTNGYAPVDKSPFFALDITPPQASVSGSSAIFSPDGDGKLDTVVFNQTVSIPDSWVAEIFALDSEYNVQGKPVRSFTVSKETASAFAWDGRTNTGALAADGIYGYRLTGQDEAGNKGISDITRVELNTEKADVILSANVLAFSPNNDGVQDSIVFSPKTNQKTDAAAVLSYTFTINDAANTAVKTVAGKGNPPASITWDGKADSGELKGKVCRDGVYSAVISVELKNGNTAKSSVPVVTLDTVYPEITLSAEYTVFSTDADAPRKNIPIVQESSTELLWTGTISSVGVNTGIHSYQWEGTAKNFAWDGTDASGNKVPDGTYRYTVFCQDTAGNKTSRTLETIQIDSRVPKGYITAEFAAISPNDDGVKDSQLLKIHTNFKDGLQSWRIVITNQEQTELVKVWSSEKGDTFPDTLQWNGKNESGEITNGNFTASLLMNYAKGDTVQSISAPFVVSIKPPELGVQLAPAYFSPDNDGNEDELFIDLSAQSDSKLKEWRFEIYEPEETGGKRFWTTGGKDKITDQIIWDGRSAKGETVQSAMEYPFTFTVTDEIGMTSVVKGHIPIDVLVIRDGDKLKMAVPSIIFRKNAADFNNLSKNVTDKNIKVLTRIAEILNKFPEYKVQVEGHANNVSGTQKEELEDLIPLSTARADAVRKFLIEKGVSKTRLSAVGMGGKKPIASSSDRGNWWKNRRVEFILIK